MLGLNLIRPRLQDKSKIILSNFLERCLQMPKTNQSLPQATNLSTAVEAQIQVEVVDTEPNDNVL